MSSDTIFVTGGAGFIGSCFLRNWLGQKRGTVIHLDKLTYAGRLESLGEYRSDPRHVFYQGDIQDRALVAALLAKHRPRGIVHFAAESHVDRSIDAPADFVMTNVVGTVQLLEAARAYLTDVTERERGEFRFLHVSTDEVYGSLGAQGAFSETTSYSPNSPYAASKAASDHFVRAYGHTFGLPILITNCSNNFGPYQFPEKLIPLMILSAAGGRALPVYGDGLQVRDWLYVEDHCAALQLVLERGRLGETYNIGGDNERTNLELVHRICELVERMRPDLSHRPCSSLIAHVADRPGHDRRYAIDAGKICAELGWRPGADFESRLEDTVRWYLERGDWVALAGAKYDGRRLGLSASRSAEPQLPATASPRTLPKHRAAP